MVRVWFQAAQSAKLLSEQNKVSTDADGKLVLADADFNGSSQGQSGYDAGMNANKDGSLDNPALSAVKGYVDNTTGQAVYLRDPAVAGFSYQTFGQVFDGSNQSQGYVSVGQSTSLADTATVKATYQGVAMGTYDKRSEVVSDMSAELNWGANAKTLSVTTTNSHIANANSLKGYTGISKDARFDFTENMTWDSTKKAFASSDALGCTYGANAEEIGGTFSKTIDGKAYEGAFGGTKQ
ncbi:hypothetical protein [Moraxella bovis]|uniref:Transferrin-binding protein B C-lobe/N-lobe beta barrel domain-containing protein n=2 Tax=Moraxella bovis TaxID=476 RepID=A0A378PQJ3_MORBO|nr:hypothetical protein [Moraxella bovis]STY90439.1 Uncharacterised protein [Moraxella bovis]